RIAAALDRALVGEAPVTLEEELDPLAAAEPAPCIVIDSHVLLLDPAPLGRAAAVVRNRGHVADGRDLETRRLQRADGSLAARARALHPHLDTLETERERLLGAALGGHLGGERRALTRALEAGLAGRGPRDHVAVRVRDGHDRVVEGRLHV